MKVFVYDNQGVYFNFVRESIPDDFDFELISSQSVGSRPKNGEVVFFLNDILELADFNRLYTRGNTLILCAQQKNGEHLPEKLNGITFVNLEQTKDALLNDIFDKLLKK